MLVGLEKRLWLYFADEFKFLKKPVIIKKFYKEHIDEHTYQKKRSPVNS